MKEGSRANALLVELLLVIFFFMIGATTLVQLFADAKHKSIQAKEINQSMMVAQNVAEELYGTDEPEETLKAMGFAEGETGWTLTQDGYTLTVTQEDKETEAGILRTFRVNAFGDGKDFYTLPSTRYIPKEVSP